jgi:hypothetical protein
MALWMQNSYNHQVLDLTYNRFVSLDSSSVFSISKQTSAISCLSWEMKVHHGGHKIQPLDPILIKLNPAHILISYFLKIPFNITL